MRLLGRAAAIAVGFSLSVLPGAARAQTTVERPEWAAAFDSAGVEGTIVLRRVGTERLEVYNPVRARRAYVPASTFKIPNSLIALETGVVRDEDERFPFVWPRSDIETWNRDHTLRTALKYSVVPVYQELARRIGPRRYATWLARLDYGNRDFGGGLDHFWLDGRLRISAVEQVGFLTRLVERRLPMSERSQRLVSAMLLREANDCYVLRAKTGLAGVAATRPVEPVGWYVGWVETDTARWVFAMNVDTSKPGAAAARAGVTKAVLARAGVIPRSGCGS